MQLPHARVAVYVVLAREDALVAESVRAQHLAVSSAKQCQGFAIVGVEYLEGTGSVQPRTGQHGAAASTAL